MIAVIGPDEVTLEEPRVLTALSARLAGMGAARSALGSGESGERIDADHAWLSVDRLRSAGPADDEWRDGFDAMITYARSRGWVDGDLVRAHLV